MPYEQPDTGLLQSPPHATLNPHNTVFTFGIFDGHGGDECSTFVSKNLFPLVEQTHLTSQSIPSLLEYWKSKGGYWSRWTSKLSSIISKIINDPSFTKDDHLYDYIQKQQEQLTHWELVKLRVWLAHLNLDQDYLQLEDKSNLSIHESNTKIQETAQSAKNACAPQPQLKPLTRSGSTATSAFIYPLDSLTPNRHFYESDTISRLLISHIGDTHCIICDSDGVARPLTRDHHPSNPKENSRLRKYGRGQVMVDSFGEERLLGYANTRSMGDSRGKTVGITAEPEFSDFMIGSSEMLHKYKELHGSRLEKNNVKDFGGDECFLVMVSDGVTNYLSDQEIVDLITTTVNNLGVKKATAQKCANEVVEFVECINGDDNASCIVIRFNGWAKWPVVDRTGSLREGKLSAGTKLY